MRIDRGMMRSLLRVVWGGRSDRTAWTRIFRVLTISCVLGLAGTTAAWAATTVTGSKGYYSTYGWNYYNYNQLTNAGAEGSWGTTYAYHDNDGSVPGGYMGAYARVYTPSGHLCVSGGWTYNYAGAVGVGETTSGGIQATCGAGNYYSQGLTRAYNGNGYNTFTTFQSPQLYI